MYKYSLSQKNLRLGHLSADALSPKILAANVIVDRWGKTSTRSNKAAKIFTCKTPAQVVGAKPTN
jgi:hypothetical protein